MAQPHPALLALAAGRSLPPVDDHDGLSASSVEHHMGGLLWSSIARGDLDGPNPWKLDLAVKDLRTQARHAQLWRGVSEVTSRLGDVGIEVAVMKGVPAESRWYDRMGERPCVDIDLLVNPDHLELVGDIITTLDPSYELRDSCSQDVFDRGLYQSLNLKVGSLRVDLHLDAFKLGPPCRHPRRVWEHTVVIACPGGGEVRVLDAELSLVHFLVHLNRDSFCWLLGYADVARILAREAIDWGAVDRLLTDEGLQVPVYAALSAVTGTLGMRHPGPRPTGWRSHLWQLLWRPSVRLQGDLGRIRFRHRPNWLPVLVDGGLPRALRWGWGQLALSEPLVRTSSPGHRGPWQWWLVRGRLRRAARRRRAVAQARRRDRRQLASS